MDREDGRLDLDGFLGHTGAGFGGGGDFLGNWKEDGKLDNWLHPRGSFAALWGHRLVRLVKDRETEALIIRPLRWRCMERESILKKQRFRLDDDSREVPPELCPNCLLIEWTRVEVREGRIGLTDEVLRFTPEDEEDEEVVIHAGGLCGLIGEGFKKKTLTKEDKKAIRRAGIRGDEVYREELAARLQYVLTIVQHDDPEAGCLIAIEAQALGDKLKRAIRDRQEDVGKEDGHPLRNPYAFRWGFDENKDFADKYDVKPMTSLPLTDEVQAVFDEDPPDIGPVIAPGNVAELRALLEEHWCHDEVPPWDELFGKAEAAVKGTPEAELPEDFNYGENAEGDGDEDDDDEAPADDEPAPGEGEPTLYECTVCGKGSEDFAKCQHCGAEYDAEGNLTHDPREKPKPKPRGSAKPRGSSAPKPAPKPRGGSRAAGSKSGGRR